MKIIICATLADFKRWCYENEYSPYNKELVKISTAIDCDKLRGLRLTNEDQVIWYSWPYRYEDIEKIKKQLMISKL